MRRPPLVCFLLALAWAIPSGLSARGGDDRDRVSYSRDVLPFIEDQCIACHDDGFETSELSMATVDSMKQGGRRGPALVPGKSAESLMIQFLKGIKQPQMPPKAQISLDQIKVIERWIDQGAIEDAIDPAVLAEREKARKKAEETEAKTFASDAPPPVTSLAYAPDGRTLAAAGYKEVLLVDPSSGRTLRKLGGFPDQVVGVAFSPDGKRLAASGGAPGKQGEVHIWETSGWQEVKVLRGHSDTALAVAWRPQSNQLATCSLDKLILIWDVDSGQVVRSIKSHSDVVGTVAYSPDGKLLASGSADKTAKLFDAETGLQVAGFTNHNDAVLQVAFSPDGKYLATASADKNMSLWNLKNFNNPERGFGHTGPVYALAWRPDSTSLWAGSGGKPSFLSYKKENGERAVPIREDTLPDDWVYAVAVAPDNQAAAVGGWAGSVTLWSLKDGSKLREFIPGREEVKGDSK